MGEIPKSFVHYKENYRYYSPIGAKTIQCIDCDIEFEVYAKDNKAKRCHSCQHIENKRIKRES